MPSQTRANRTDKCHVMHFHRILLSLCRSGQNALKYVAFLQHHSRYHWSGTRFHQRQLGQPLRNVKYSVQAILRWLRTEQRWLLPIGGAMKRTMIASVLLMIGCFSFPISARQQDLQEVMNAANALGARESELLGKKDAAGIAALFTSDGLLVMLVPQFAFKPGHDAIQKHYQGIIDAGATSIVLELKNMELRSGALDAPAGSLPAPRNGK
jgi:hypothetical protein